LLDCMGLALQRQGRIPEAIDYCTLAIKADPTAAYLYSDLGVIYVLQDRLPEAVEQFRMATQLDPAFLDGHSNLGHALLKLNQPGEAIAVFRRALGLKPGHPKAELGLVLGLAMADHADEAMRLYRHTLRHQQVAGSVHGDLGDILIKQGKTTEAIECYGQAWQLEPNSPRVLNNLSWLLATSEGIERPRREQAVVLAEQLVRRAGHTDPEPLDTLAAAYAAVGRYPEAVQTAQQAIELALAGRKSDLAREMRLRLDAYKAGRPYREPPVPVTLPLERPGLP
jgi:Flp pilus assembly protein TadD